jgi:hypothetical protein
MTEYNFHEGTVHRTSVNEAKEKRRKILEAVFERRRENYIRHLKKMQLKRASDLATIS